MGATSCVVGNFALAIGAQAGVRLGSRGRGELVDLLYHHKNNEGQNQKVHDSIDKAAISQHGSTSFFSCLQGGIFFAVQADKKVFEINLTHGHANGRHNDVIN